MNKIGEKAIQTYYHAAEKTGKIAREIKLKANMAENKAKIKELYEEIGEEIYQKYVLKENMDMAAEIIQQNCSMIDILADEIEEYRMEFLKLKDLKQCEHCHYEIDVDFHYCPNCGHKQEEQESAQVHQDRKTDYNKKDIQEHNNRKTDFNNLKQKDAKAVTIETTDNQDSVLIKKHTESQE